MGNRGGLSKQAQHPIIRGAGRSLRAFPRRTFAAGLRLLRPPYDARCLMLFSPFF